jgi:hypothetical protein
MKIPAILIIAAGIMLTPVACVAEDATIVKLPAKEKFHLYLLIGQSNMAGRGTVDEQSKQADPRILTLTKDRTWVPATDPIHFDKAAAGVGMGITFAKDMAARDPSITIGLIPCAVGGSPLSSWERGAENVQVALERCKVAMKDGTLKGILWHQGETDAGDAELTRTYATRLTKTVADLRKDLGTPDVPFVAGETCHAMYGHGTYPYGEQINAALRAMPQTVPNSACATAENLGHKGDAIHFDTAAMREFGHRYAREMLRLQSSGVAKPTTISTRPSH